MTPMKKHAAGLAITALVAIEMPGCAIGSGFQPGVAAGPGARTTLLSCSLAGGGPQGFMPPSLRLLGHARQQASAAQQRAMLGFATRTARMEGWKSIAAGEC